MLKLLFDFTDLRAVNAWHAIDDRVMGGIRGWVMALTSDA
jgi:hypothetical protein